ncbi:hypothetical protein F8203_gp150 [Heliothis virescens ascovirus 3f]|uniref:Uncharacterized protein n=1 Tax=Heliothis virescens ascovirus 3f TaxID=328614 RepID=A0A171PVN6_9VIRU|nr:hypothetical protein F8203_gp150 [Heliothis virescens ascovirus 3f]AJP09116.1 hypothetical protein [Heliothis virescens ascovirus 3f]
MKSRSIMHNNIVITMTIVFLAIRTPPTKADEVMDKLVQIDNTVKETCALTTVTASLATISESLGNDEALLKRVVVDPLDTKVEKALQYQTQLEGLLGRVVVVPVQDKITEVGGGVEAIKSSLTSVVFTPLSEKLDAIKSDINGKCQPCRCKPGEVMDDKSSTTEERVAFGLTRTEWISLSLQSINLGFTVSMFGVIMHMMIRY